MVRAARRMSVGVSPSGARVPSAAAAVRVRRAAGAPESE
jgi:hypothetical protein